MPDQVEKCRLRPVDVFEDDDEGLSSSLELEQLPRAPEHLVQRVVGFSQPNR
jgi:hypothetical protein